MHSKTVLRVFPGSLKLQVKVLNLRRFNKKSEMLVELIRELLFFLLINRLIYKISWINFHKPAMHLG